MKLLHCEVCSTGKPVSDFAKVSHFQGKEVWICKDCATKRKTQKFLYSEEKGAKVMLEPVKEIKEYKHPFKICEWCNERKPWADYKESIGFENNLYPFCKECEEQIRSAGLIPNVKTSPEANWKPAVKWDTLKTSFEKKTTENPFKICEKCDEAKPYITGYKDKDSKICLKCETVEISEKQESTPKQEPVIMKITKTCSRCGLSQPLIQYSKDSHRHDGMASHCRTCQAKYDAGRKPKQSTEIKIPLKKCRRCDQEKTLDCFGKNAAYPDSLQPICKECKIDHEKGIKMKPCLVCELKKPFDEYYNDSKKKDGKGVMCKSCWKERYKKSKPKKVPLEKQKPISFCEFTKNDIEKIVDLVLRGINYEIIAKEFGVPLKRMTDRIGILRRQGKLPKRNEQMSHVLKENLQKNLKELPPKAEPFKSTEEIVEMLKNPKNNMPITNMPNPIQVILPFEFKMALGNLFKSIGRSSSERILFFKDILLDVQKSCPDCELQAYIENVLKGALK